MLMHIPRPAMAKVKIGYLAPVVLLLVSLFGSFSSAYAAQITGRKLTLGSSAASASTTYTFNFTLPSSTVLQSFKAQICDAASSTCNAPAGFSSGSASLGSQPTNLGDASGWSFVSTAGELRIKKTGNSAAPSGAVTVVFNGVQNPSATNTTFFARLTTYSDDAFTTAVDTGTVAASTANQITITASVDETLTFSISSSSVDFSTLSTGSIASNDSITMAAATNATSGYTVSYLSAPTLTSGANTIPAMSSAGAVAGTAGFGFNLKANTTPPKGADPTGTGTGTPSTGYDTADQFSFNTSGAPIASAAGATASNTYKFTFVADISASTKPGNYSTTITFLCTPTF